MGIVKSNEETKHLIHRQIVNVFLPIILSYDFGAQKNHLIETVLVSTHNICVGWEIRELFFLSAFFTKGFVFSYILLYVWTYFFVCCFQWELWSQMKKRNIWLSRPLNLEGMFCFLTWNHMDQQTRFWFLLHICKFTIQTGLCSNFKVI